MRRYIVAAVVLVGVGVGVSLLLIPDSIDQALQQATDSKAVDVGNVDVEAEYAQGRRSFPIIAKLADKRVAAEDRPAAIKLWEEYVAANPTDIQGKKKLAEQYQLAGRQDDYNHQLEAIAAAEPTEANLRILSDIYNANKDYPKQADVLKKILTVNKGENPQTFVDLATIQLVINDKDGALKTLDALKAKHPTYNSYAMTRILVAVLAEKGEVDRALEVAQAWANTPAVTVTPAAPVAAPTADQATTADADPRPKELADLCNILHYSGHPDKAIALVEPHLDMLARSPELMVAYVNADVDAGRADHAYALLKKIDEAQQMTPTLYPIYLELAIKREDLPAAETIANKMDVLAFNEEQALNILEIARANHAPAVQKILLTRFSDAKVLEGKPVLAAVIAIIQNDKLQDKKIDTALATQLSGTQRIRLAESCARAQKTACFNAIVKQYPALDAMSPQQISEYAQLYIIADRPKEIIDPVGVKAALPNAHADVIQAHHRLAAAAGRMDVLKPWLEANANTAPIAQVQELYYIANDHHQSAVASDVAQRLYARDPSPINRDIYISALVSSGRNDQALPLLREQMKEPGANDGLYLSTLAKVARKNSASRKELNDYAENALKSGHGDGRQQLNYAYILINNGERKAALPYVRNFAAERGGEWKRMLAQLTPKPVVASATAATAPAPTPPTREERIELARGKNISDSNKREIAFSLLNDGYKNDAADIFRDLAKDKGPESQEVKDLLFIWGGKVNAEQMEWIHNRAANATPYDKAQWAEIINNAADDSMLVRYVGTTPDALYSRPLRQKYFHLLAATGNRQNYDTAMREWVAKTTDVPALTDYADTAQASGFREAAANGYKRILALDPANSKALNQMAAMEFSKGKFSEADKNVTQYLAVQAKSPDADGNLAQAHFFKGELLRRAGKKAEADAEYAQVVSLTKVTDATAPDALSRLYTAQFRLGQHDAAKEGFNKLLAAHPDDKSILADYMSALIEYRYLSEATRVANQYDKTSPSYKKGTALEGKSDHISSVQRMSGGRELKITFDHPIENQVPMKLANAAQLPWLENSTVGYDSVSISAKPGYVVRYVPVAQEQFQVVPSSAPTPQYSPEVETQRQQDLRLQLLYARIEEDSGQTAKANERLAVLKQYYPNDAQLISYEAALANASGNRGEALSLLRQAQTISPENEDIALLLQNTKRAGMPVSSNYAKIDEAYRGIGKNDEYITTLSGGVHSSSGMEFGANVQNDLMYTKNIRRDTDGRFGNYDLTRQRGEFYGAYTLESGERLQGSLFGNNDTAGLGAYLGLSSQIGRLEILGEYHRPYWDFVEAVAEDTTRDRVGIKDFVSITPTLSAGVELSMNNYNIDVEDSVRQTGLARISLVQQMQPQTEQQPYLGIGYGFDGEYKTGADPKTRADFTGQQYQPFPLTDREIHSLTGIYQNDWSPVTHVRFVAGVAYDRFSNAVSPLADGRIDYDLTPVWQLGGRARYALETNNTDNHQLDLGADLIYKF